MEDQAAFLQQLKTEAKLSPGKARDQLLSELVDTVSLLCHQVYRLGVLAEGLGETLEDVQDQLDSLVPLEAPEDGAEEPGEEDTITDRLLYEVKCPQCGDRFAVDEATLLGGFSCPTCGEHLVQAEEE